MHLDARESVVVINLNPSALPQNFRDDRRLVIIRAEKLDQSELPSNCVQVIVHRYSGPKDRITNFVGGRAASRYTSTRDETIDLLAEWGIGQPIGQDDPLPKPRVIITPATLTLSVSATQQFSATGGEMLWSVMPELGTIDATGLYIAPAEIVAKRTVTVKAVSLANSANSATAVITLQAPPLPPPPRANPDDPSANFPPSPDPNGPQRAKTLTLREFAQQNLPKIEGLGHYKAGQKLAKLAAAAGYPGTSAGFYAVVKGLRDEPLPPKSSVRGSHRAGTKAASPIQLDPALAARLQDLVDLFQSGAGELAALLPQIAAALTQSGRIAELESQVDALTSEKGEQMTENARLKGIIKRLYQEAVPEDVGS